MLGGAAATEIGWLCPWVRREALEQQGTGGEIHHGRTTGRYLLVFLAQATIPAPPGQRAFHYPPTGQEDKPLLAGRTHDNVQGDAIRLLQPGHQGPAVCLVRPNPS